MKKTLLCFFCSILLLQIGSTQSIRFTIEKPIALVKADNANAFYTVDIDNTVAKYNQTGRKLCSFSLQKYGQITNLDVTSPFQTMVHYGNSGFVIFLDSNFEKLGELNLTELGHSITAPIALAPDKSGFYVHDANKGAILKYDIRGKVISEINGLQIEEIEKMLIADRKIYLQGGNQLVISELLGQSKDNFSLNNIKIIDFYKGALIGEKAGEIVELSNQTGETKKIDLPFKKELSDKIFVSQNYIFLIRNKIFNAY
jgi:hypothetical protein